MAKEPTSTGNIHITGDEACDVYQPINVIGNQNQIILAPSHERKSSEISRIHHDVQDPIESFTGREDILAEISEIIEKNRIQGKMTVLSQTNVVTGLGGIGKTETIRKYIYECKSSYGHILWINAETFLEARNSFSRIAKKLKMRPEEFEKGLEPLRDAVQEIYERLCNKRTLVIFDNAEKLGAAPAEEGIFAFLPKSIQPGWEKPTIIATSRIRKWKNVSVIELDGLHVDETYKLLLTQLGFNDTKENRSFGAEIALHTQGLPLAIQVVIGIIRRESDKREAKGEINYTMQDFLAEFKKCDSDFIDEEPHDSPVKQSILNIFNISFQKLQKETHGILAMKTLTIMSWLSPDNIPKSLLFLCVPEEEQVFLPNALLLLHSFGLANMKSTYFQVHRLIQRVVLYFVHSTVVSSAAKKKSMCSLSEPLIQSTDKDFYDTPLLSTNEQINKLLMLTITRFENILENMEPQSSNILYETLENGYQLAQHIRNQSPIALKFHKILAEKLEYNGRYTDSITILEKTKSDLTDFPEGTLLQDSARLYNQNGKYTKAEELYQLIIKNEELHKTNNEASILQIKHDLAGVFVNQGKYAEAVELYRYILEARETILGQNHLDALSTKHMLANVLDHQGKYDEAVELYQNVLEVRKNILGQNHPQTLNTKHKLGSVFKNQGRYEEAAELYQHVLEARENILGRNHPDTLKTKHKLASVFTYQGRYEKAVELYQHVLDDRKNILGQNHPETLTTKHKLASVFDHQGKYDDAVEQYQMVLEAREVILGPNHPETLTSKHNMANVFEKQGKYADAVTLFIYVLEARTSILGHDHPDTLASKHKLASVFMNQGNYKKAAEMYKHILKARQTILGQNHPETLTTKHKLANVFAHQGKYSEARKLYLHVLEARENIISQNHPDTLNTKHLLASVYKNQRKYDRALELCQYVVEARENILGQNHPDTLTTKQQLASVYKNQGRYDEALELCKHVSNAREKHLDQNHPETLTSKHKLASIFKIQGKYDEAMKLYQHVLEARENILGQNHPKTLTTKHKLAGVSKSHDKYEKAMGKAASIMQEKSKLEQVITNNLEHVVSTSSKQCIQRFKFK